MSSTRVVFFYLALLISLLGCAGNVGVTSRGCKASEAKIMSEELEFQADYSWNKKVWSSSETNLIRIKDLLVEKELDCSDVARVRYQVGQTFWDQLFSIFPFFSRMTVKVDVQRI
jgi:hypothetical protein